MAHTHEFDPRVADVYGINAALIFQHICYLAQGQNWVSLTLPALCKKYPYLGRDQVWRALKALTHPGPKTPPLVLRKGKERGNSHMYAPIPKDGFCENPHKFSTNLANELGVVPAIIYRNIRYWILKNWMDRADELYGRMKPEQFDYDVYAMKEFSYDNTRKAAAHFCTVDQWLEEHRYIGRSTVFSGFTCLLEEGLLKRTYLADKVPSWKLPGKTLFCYKRKVLEGCDLKNSSPKTKLPVQEPNAQSKNQTLNPKTKFENRGDLPETESVEPNPASVQSISYDAEVFAAQKAAFSKHSDGSVEDDGTASGSLELRSVVESLNRPGRPHVAKPKKKKEPALGWSTKRKYTKHVLDDAGFGELNE